MMNLDEGPVSDPFSVGQRVIVHATRTHIHDTSDGEDADEFCGEWGMIVAPVTDNAQYDFLICVGRTQGVYRCVIADLSDAGCVIADLSDVEGQRVRNER